MSSTLDAFPPPTTDPVGPPRPDETVQEPVAPSPTPRRRHGVWHVLAIVAGAVTLLPGLGLVAGGTALAVAESATDDGWFRYTPDRIESTGVAVISDHDWLDEPADNDPWVLDWLDLDLRVRAAGAAGTDEVFIGVARTADVLDYLDAAGYSVVTDLDNRTIEYRQEPGASRVEAPTSTDIWTASTSGTGEQELTWQARGGRWTVVVMNADGSAGVAADTEIGVRSDAVGTVAVVMIVGGGITVLVGLVLLVVGIRGRRTA